MKELPKNSFSDGFYIWFNFEEKEEYYATPLYLYNTKRNGEIEDKRFSLELMGDISKIEPSKEEARKHPAVINYPYVESIGLLLIRLLNADFSTFETAYNTFFYAYGFELIKEYSPGSELQYRYSSEIEMLSYLKPIYKESLDKLLEIQSNYRKSVDFIYNLNGNNDLSEYKRSSKFNAYAIKNDIYTDSKNIEVILDDYINKHHKYSSEKLENLVHKLENNESSLNLTNFYTSSYLSSICFVVLQQIVGIENVVIKQCQNCGKYFIPTYRQTEVYCDFQNLDDTPTCREKGAMATYKKNLEDVPALKEYRKQYQKKVMIVYRSKGDKQLKKDFDKWKNEAQRKIKQFKQGTLAEGELYKWIMDNK